LYFYNMRYGDDPDLKGDVNVRAHGSEAIMVKEQAAQRQAQFLQMALQSPVVEQVVGMDGIAELLRQMAKQLELNPDKIVPPVEIIKQKMANQQAQQQAQQQAAMAQQMGQAQSGGTPPKPTMGAQLMNGAPVANNFAPQAGVSS